MAERSIVFDGFNGWKATIIANGMAMVFGETTIPFDGLAMVSMVANHWSNEPLVGFILV